MKGKRMPEATVRVQGSRTREGGRADGYALQREGLGSHLRETKTEKANKPSSLLSWLM